MGDRYYFKITCPICKHKDNDTYFAPTCGIVDWVCPECHYTVDLYKYTGISYKDASNAEIINSLIERLT